MTGILFTPDSLIELLEAIEDLLSDVAWPERFNASDPACTVHPDALIALEDAYDRLMDCILESKPDGAEAAP